MNKDRDQVAWSLDNVLDVRSDVFVLCRTEPQTNANNKFQL